MTTSKTLMRAVIDCPFIFPAVEKWKDVAGFEGVLLEIDDADFQKNVENDIAQNMAVYHQLKALKSLV